jgi:transketolase C-terminal domain/subunit
VHEALAAAEVLESGGISIGLFDVPSTDKQLLLRLYDTGKPVFIAEQNNGYIWSEYRRVLFREKKEISTQNLIPINTLDEQGNPGFIHSAAYSELLEQFGLSAEQLAKTIRKRLQVQGSITIFISRSFASLNRRNADSICSRR